MSAVYRSRLKWTSFFILLLMLCNTKAYSEATPVKNTIGEILTLDECISIGLKTNPSAEISLQSLKTLQEKTGEAKGGYYPSFKFSSSYTYTTPLEGKAAESADNYDTRFSVRQPLYDGGATSNLVQGLRQSIKAQEYDVKKTTLDIILTIRSAFYETVKRRDLLAVAKSSLISADKHFEQAKALYQEGLSPRSDVIKAEVQVTNAQLDVIKAENAAILAKANLATAMGLPVMTIFELEIKGPALQMPLLPAIGDTIKHAYEGRPEIRSIRAKIESAKTNIRQAESGLYPGLSLDASYGWQKDTFMPDDRKWSVGLTISIPVFEQLTTRSKINQAVANLNGIKSSELQTLRNVELDVQQAWVALKEALERLNVTRKALELAVEDIRVSEGRYKEGLGNILEVIDAQTALTQARVNDVVAIYDIANAKAKLDRATGEGMQEESK